jgi:hypothetical protein
VGFAESLPYDKKKVPKAAEDEGFATDCEMGIRFVSSLASKASTNACAKVRQILHYWVQNGGRLSSKVPEMTPGSPASEATKDAISKISGPVVQV